MTNQDLELLYGQLLGMGHTAALKAVYNLGYAAGAGTSVDDNLTDKTKVASVPTVAQVKSLVNNPKLKN